MKKFLIVLFILVQGLIFAAGKNLADIKTLKFDVVEKTIIKSKKRELTYKIDFILPNKIKKEVIAPKLNKGEIYMYDYSANKKSVYLPMFNETKESEIVDDENRIIKAINKIIEEEKTNKNFKQKYDYKLESLKCDHCGKKIEKGLNRLKNYFLGKTKHIYCSNECSYEARKKRVEVSCDYCNKKYEIIESKFKNHKKHFCCNEHKKLYLHKEKETYAEIAHYLRSTTEYEKWKNSCLERDNYTCQKCGSRSNIIVHHIEQLYNIVQKYNNNLDDIIKSAEFNDIKNGVSLCTECHQKEHPWMRNRKGQFVNSIAASSSTDSEDDD